MIYSFIFWKLEKNWTFLLHSVSGKRCPLTVAGSCGANELERAAGLQSEAGLALCSVQMVTHQHQLLRFLSFLFRCYTIPVFFIDMHFSEMLRKLYWRGFWGQSYLTNLTFFGIRVWTPFRTKSLLTKWVVLSWGDLQLQVPFFSILSVKR